MKTSLLLLIMSFTVQAFSISKFELDKCPVDENKFREARSAFYQIENNHYFQVILKTEHMVNYENLLSRQIKKINEISKNCAEVENRYLDFLNRVGEKASLVQKLVDEIHLELNKANP